jgi:hypothetical protein
MKKLKIVHYLFIVIISLLVALVSTLIVSAVSPWGPISVPLPPTPGPPPPSVSDTETDGGDSITNREQAIQRALFIDSKWAIREQSLTEEKVAANPDMVVVESYATRQEAVDAYWGGGFDDPELASEPVWVVIIKGKVSLQTVGGMGAQESVEADEVIYVISQKTGLLLRVSTDIPQKQSDDQRKD